MGNIWKYFLENCSYICTHHKKMKAAFQLLFLNTTYLYNRLLYISTIYDMLFISIIYMPIYLIENL